MVLNSHDKIIVTGATGFLGSHMSTGLGILSPAGTFAVVEDPSAAVVEAVLRLC